MKIRAPNEIWSLNPILGRILRRVRVPLDPKYISYFLFLLRIFLGISRGANWTINLSTIKYNWYKKMLGISIILQLNIYKLIWHNVTSVVKKIISRISLTLTSSILHAATPPSTPPSPPGRLLHYRVLGLRSLGLVLFLSLGFRSTPKPVSFSNIVSSVCTNPLAHLGSFISSFPTFHFFNRIKTSLVTTEKPTRLLLLINIYNTFSFSFLIFWYDRNPIFLSLHKL